VVGKGHQPRHGLRTRPEQRFRLPDAPSFTASPAASGSTRTRDCLAAAADHGSTSARRPVEAARRSVSWTARAEAIRPSRSTPAPAPSSMSSSFRAPSRRGEAARRAAARPGRRLRPRARQCAQFPLAVATEIPAARQVRRRVRHPRGARGGCCRSRCATSSRLTGDDCRNRRCLAGSVAWLDDLEIMGWLERVKTGMEPRGEWLEGKDGEATWKELRAPDPVLGQARSERITVPVADDARPSRSSPSRCATPLLRR